jgi:hypothetical protein
VHSWRDIEGVFSEGDKPGVWFLWHHGDRALVERFSDARDRVRAMDAYVDSLQAQLADVWTPQTAVTLHSASRVLTMHQHELAQLFAGLRVECARHKLSAIRLWRTLDTKPDDVPTDVWESAVGRDAYGDYRVSLPA